MKYTFRIYEYEPSIKQMVEIARARNFDTMEAAEKFWNEIQIKDSSIGTLRCGHLYKATGEFKRPEFRIGCHVDLITGATSTASHFVDVDTWNRIYKPVEL